MSLGILAFLLHNYLEVSGYVFQDWKLPPKIQKWSHWGMGEILRLRCCAGQVSSQISAWLGSGLGVERPNQHLLAQA